MGEFFPLEKGEGPYLKVVWKNESGEGEIKFNTQLLLPDLLNSFFMFLLVYGYVFEKEDILDAADSFWPIYEKKDESSTVERLELELAKLDEVLNKKSKKKGSKK